MKQLIKKVVAVMLTGAAILFSYSTANAQKSEIQQNETELEDKKMMSSVLHLKIKGMHCESGCANGIDAMLKEQQGIIKSKTSFDQSSAVIEYDPILISEEEIVSLITGRGFEVEVVTEKGDIPQD
ncbi:heavy metal-associated domain-containing protein [Zunongwangia sp. F260]|uniref:Heavy metal-associated domain-containing protein n=1 Tax=Autumnicola lenta TaxID=3075593 RepID=A0ABU3CJJ2_9FLAO|nr:heavy metal-associated domain-containing protein [Zunongwangia sp. F260]MDT0646471.1 heavy metal-associated domain-containing protein [Zunongwangia sp. F260]